MCGLDDGLVDAMGGASDGQERCGRTGLTCSPPILFGKCRAVRTSSDTEE